MFETFENILLTLLLSISPKVRIAMISIMVGLFVFLYFANGLLTLAISSDKPHLNIIFVNGIFYFDCSVCYCIFKLNRYPFFRSYKDHWYSQTGLRFLKSSFFFFISPCQ